MDRIDERVVEICRIERDDIFVKGKQQKRVVARSIFCYWVVRELILVPALCVGTRTPG